MQKSLKHRHMEVKYNMLPKKDWSFRIKGGQRATKQTLSTLDSNLNSSIDHHFKTAQSASFKKTNPVF